MHSHKKTQSLEGKKAVVFASLDVWNVDTMHGGAAAIKRWKAKNDRAGKANPSEAQWALRVKQPLQASAVYLQVPCSVRQETPLGT